jgi:ribosomal protein S18 acetylase RimI-like enzyme
MNNVNVTIREVLPEEHKKLGQLMIDAYSNLEGFPAREEMPDYYEMLSTIGRFNMQPDTIVLVASSSDDILVGGVVYFSDMSRYDAEGLATEMNSTSGIRLLGVDPKFGRTGAGRALTNACIQLARNKEHSCVVLHTTEVMKDARALYEKLGFERSPTLDIERYGVPILGFTLQLL